MLHGKRQKSSTMTYKATTKANGSCQEQQRLPCQAHPSTNISHKVQSNQAVKPQNKNFSIP